ncbi:hypothetical protein [Alicyclobacillus fastidiosus]|uniref:MFS transporter n=1 Tax=Alicyclobacillus fastidiosus TaxID=392011 RepID=A0ABV5AIR7_9BACL|nr:hypothetical protein [Alicyclobacillus fastidiosus]WEH07793.1 hypothetical protein PYS47_13550 [Alicyclobacillus fastidiosus]
MRSAWERLGPHKTVRLLQLAALLRSVCQGIAVVDVSLYLKALGWNGTAIGALFAISGIIRSLLMTFAGEINAYLGAKRYIALFEFTATLAALGMSLTDNAIVVWCAVSVSGFGRGHSGSGGPISPIERSWLNAYGQRSRGTTSHAIFGLNAGMSYIGMGVGCALAGLPSLWGGVLHGPSAYRPLFAAMSGLSLACSLLIVNVSGGKRKTSAHPLKSESPVKDADSLQDGQHAQKAAWSHLGSILTCTVMVAVLIRYWTRWFPHSPQLRLLIPFAIVMVITGLKYVWGLALPAWKRSFRTAGASGETESNEKPPNMQAVKQLVNLLNGVAITLSSTMTSYWFSIRFGTPTEYIGLVMAISYLVTGLVALATIRLAPRIRPVQSIICLQLCGVVLVLTLPFAPWFWLAAILNICCVALNLGSRGSRSTVLASGQRRKRSWQAKVSAIILLFLTTGAWPATFGEMLEDGEFILPFFIAAAAQLMSTLWFWRTHRSDQRVP